MAQCPDGVPWWRVVAKTGALPIAKRDPYAEMDQRRLLEREGVRFVDDLIDMDTHAWQP
jgi:alkylated DNA nucleotide flippase Atl1